MWWCPNLIAWKDHTRGQVLKTQLSWLSFLCRRWDLNQEEEDQNWLDGIFVKLVLEQFSGAALQTKIKTISNLDFNFLGELFRSEKRWWSVKSCKMIVTREEWMLYLLKSQPNLFHLELQFTLLRWNLLQDPACDPIDLNNSLPKARTLMNS